MKPIPVFLDTSVLPRHPSKIGIAFKRLCQLSRSGVIKVYLSEVSANEWMSQLQDGFSKNIHEAQRAIRNALNEPWIEEIKTRQTFKAAEEEIAKVADKIPQIAEKGVKKLLKQLRVNVLPIKDHHGKIVMEDYFKGLPPFKIAKNRKDIPDAYIFQSAKDLLIELKSELYGIVADQELRNSLSKLKNFKVYSEIETFVHSDVLLKAATIHKMEQIWVKHFIKILESLPTHESRLRQDIERLYLEELPYTTVSHPGIPSDNQEAMITLVGEPTDLEFNWDKAEDFGVGLIALPFQFTCEVEVEFNIYCADAFSVPEAVWVIYGDFEEDRYFEAGGSLYLSVEGVLSLEFDIGRMGIARQPVLVSVNIDRLERNAIGIDDQIFIASGKGIGFLIKKYGAA